jgi:hypothetical protein
MRTAIYVGIAVILTAAAFIIFGLTSCDHHGMVSLTAVVGHCPPPAIWHANIINGSAGGRCYTPGDHKDWVEDQGSSTKPQ